MPDPKTITMVDSHGEPHDIPLDKVDAARVSGFRVQGDDERTAAIAAQAKDDKYGTPLGKVGAFAAEFNRTATFGLSDVVGTAIDPEQKRHYAGLKEVNPGASALGGAAAVIATLPTGGSSVVSQALAKTPGAIVGRIGADAARVGEGASAITKIGRAAVGGAVEGGLYGAGAGVSELALSDKPLDVERVASTLSSHMLFGGLVGGAAGSIGKVAEIGLAKARGAMDDIAAGVGKGSDDALRAGEQKAIADDIAALRKDIKGTEQWATTKDLKMPATVEGKLSAGELGRTAAKAEKQLANILDNPIGLAKNPAKAVDALQRQESALVKLLEHGDDLKAAYAIDGLGGKRLAALEAAPKILEQNRAIQGRIEALVASAPAQGAGMIGSVANKVQGSTLGMAAGAATSILGGGPLASLAVGAISKVVGDKVVGRLGKGIAEQAAKTARHVSTFLGGAEKATRSATPLATKALASVRFAPERPSAALLAKPASGSSTLAELFHERSHEIRSQTMPGPKGAEMRPEARQDLADRIKAIEFIHPQLADKLETMAARRMTFLADKLPKRPDIAGIPIGPDRWRPSDFEMRKWARYVAGVEDPGGIEERLASGVVSVEDREVMQKVYPERLAEITRQIVEQLPTVKTLSYDRRLALSTLTGVPIVPATDPRIQAVLQGQYAKPDDGPKAMPQGGSATKSAPEPTPAQARSA